MKELIRQRARELGFDHCGITTANPPESAPRFRQWLADGWHGEMAYLDRNPPRRFDPRQVLPGAHSIIVLAVSYSDADHRTRKTHHQEPADVTRHALRTAPHGLIARYARYKDYHDVIGRRLQLLTQFINQLGAQGTRSLWYVDTGPLLERNLAQRAGVGFIGKHTNLISRRLGNWIFLSEIITTLELEPDTSEKNRCGSCTRCLEACPTQAIKAPFQLDARLCISYLTIELKGSIPVELRPAIGNRVYGCDDCLAACPWNRFAQQGNLMKTHARPALAAPDLIKLLSVDETEFSLRFGDTPMRRARRRGLLRNVCVALGNVGDATALPALERAAQDHEPLIAEHARWAIEQVQARLEGEKVTRPPSRQSCH